VDVGKRPRRGAQLGVIKPEKKQRKGKAAE
jgi:hypothetical protein